MDLRLETYGPLSLEEGIPPELASYKLAHASGRFARGSWGLLCIQEIRTEQFLFRHFLFSLQQNIAFSLQDTRHYVQSLLSLAGTFEHSIPGLNTVRLEEKDFILFHAARYPATTRVYSGVTSSLLSTSYTPSAYRDLLPLFPAFKHAVRKAARKPFHFSYPARRARYSVYDAIHALWFDKYKADLQAKHTEIRLKSSLFTLLAQSYTAPVQEPVSSLEQEKAAAARALILNNIKVHLPPEHIALQLHCSVSWLKKAFSKVHGTGMYHFLRQTRMQRAKEMLLAGASLKAVALEVGMKPRNFPKEFKTFFGYTVTALKKGLV